jgi:dolichol kinase
VIHIFTLGYLVVYFVCTVSYGHQVTLIVLTGMLVVMILIEYARLQLKLDIPLLRNLYDFRRRREEEHIGGEIYFLLGVLVSLAVFEMSVAVARC